MRLRRERPRQVSGEVGTPWGQSGELEAGSQRRSPTPPPPRTCMSARWRPLGKGLRC